MHTAGKQPTNEMHAGVRYCRAMGPASMLLSPACNAAAHPLTVNSPRRVPVRPPCASGSRRRCRCSPAARASYPRPAPLPAWAAAAPWAAWAAWAAWQGAARPRRRATWTRRACRWAGSSWAAAAARLSSSRHSVHRQRGLLWPRAPAKRACAGRTCCILTTGMGCAWTTGACPREHSRESVQAEHW